MGVDYLCRSAVLYACASGCCTGRRSPADCRRDPVSGNRLWRGYCRKICPRKELRGTITSGGHGPALRSTTALTLCSVSLDDVVQGIHALSADLHDVVDVRARAEAGASHGGELLAPGDPRTGLHEEALQVAVGGANAVAVVQGDGHPEATLPAGEDD